MKAIIEFDLPKDNFSHLAAIKGVDTAAAYDAIRDYCLNKIENADKINNLSARYAYEDILNILRSEAFDRGIQDVVLKV